MTAFIKVKSEMESIIYKNVKRFDVIQKGKGEFWFLYVEVGNHQKIYIALEDVLRFTMIGAESGEANGKEA